MMERLSEKEWKEFDFTDIFDIRKGFYNKKPEGSGKGTIPFLGATDSNNGVTRFLTAEEIDSASKTGDMNNVSLKRKMFAGHAIAVTNNGSVGHAYYQAVTFTCSHDINPLYLRDHEMTRDEADFLIKAIEEQGKLFQYARKWRPIRMVKSKIMLPVTDSGEPDYDYMAHYASEMRGGMLMRYKNYIAEQLSQLEYKEIPAPNEKKWENFLVPDIFPKIQRGKRLKNADHIPGNMPYVSSTAINNGVDDYVEATDGTRVFENCISLANSGSVGTAFYEPFSFVASDHVTSLKLEEASKFIYLFLASAIEKQGSNFNFNREINDLRIKKMQVMLPVTDSSEPDYAYMEQYSKNMMLRKYEQYLAFIGSKQRGQ